MKYYFPSKLNRQVFHAMCCFILLFAANASASENDIAVQSDSGPAVAEELQSPSRLEEKFPWEMFMQNFKVPPENTLPQIPPPTCAEHNVTICKWEAGGGEVERLFLPNCQVRFYEFGQQYYTGTWVPISEVEVLVHGKWSSYEGILIGARSYKEGRTIFSCR